MTSPPSNNVTVAASASANASRASFPSQIERERDRKPKALVVARHRAKRKAYVEQVTILPSDRSPICIHLGKLLSLSQLEETIVRLQAAMNMVNDETETPNRAREHARLIAPRKRPLVSSSGPRNVADDHLVGMYHYCELPSLIEAIASSRMSAT